MSRKVVVPPGIGLLTLIVGVAGFGLGIGGAWGQQQGGHGMPHGQMMQAPAPGTVQPSGEAGHQEHRTPEGWKFALPTGGDPAKGRALFVKLECFACHEVKGENFPAPAPGKVGPELSAMAPLHPPEYFAEAIVNPSAAIEKGRGYEAPDGSSKMPSYNDDLTVRDLLDLVAYLVSLRPSTSGAAPAAPAPAPGGPGGH